MFKGTVMTWVETFADRDWSFPDDTARIAAAFRTLRTTCTTWPSPKQFLDALKPRVSVASVPRERRLGNDRVCDSGLQHTSEILDELQKLALSKLPDEMRLSYEPGSGS